MMQHPTCVPVAICHDCLAPPFFLRAAFECWPFWCAVDHVWWRVAGADPIDLCARCDPFRECCITVLLKDVSLFAVMPTSHLAWRCSCLLRGMGEAALQYRSKTTLSKVHCYAASQRACHGELCLAASPSTLVDRPGFEAGG